jgi:NTE family protein
LHKRIDKLYGFEEFSQVYYDLFDQDGKTELVAKIKDNKDYYHYLKLGVRLYTDLKGTATFGAKIEFTHGQLNGLGAEWRNEFEVGDSIKFLTEFYQPIEPSLRYFVNPRATFDRRILNLFTGSLIVSQVLDSYAILGMDVGRHIGNIATVLTGFEEEFGNFDNRVGAFVPLDKYNLGRYFVKTKIDTLDQTNVPHSGMAGLISWEHSPNGIGSDFIYEKLHGFWSGFLPIRLRDTINFHLEGGTHFGNQLPLQEFYSLGGLFRLSGFQKDEVSGQHYMFSRLSAYHRIGVDRLAIKSIPTYIGFTGEAGNAWFKASDISFDSLVAAGSLFIMLDTVLGPITIAGGYNSKDKASLYLSVGRWFE